MNQELFEIGGWVVTPWKLVGYAGVACFGGRWLLQIIVSTKARKPVLPSIFWAITLVGAMLQMSYFIWGKNDSVGILASASPLLIGAYNIYLEMTHRKRLAGDSETTAEPAAPQKDDDAQA